MLGSFGLEGVLLSFHSNHSFCLSFSLPSCGLVFREVAVVSSSSFFFCPTCHSSAENPLRLMPDFRYLEIFFHIFDLLVDIFSLTCFLKELIEVLFLLNASFNQLAVLVGLYQVFQYSVICLLAELAILWFFVQSRRVCDNTPSCDLFLLVKRESGVMLVLFW